MAIALAEKELDFAIVDIDWRDTAEALAGFGGLELSNSLEGEFPILVDGEAAVGDSYFVLEYLDQKYPVPPLRPVDAYGQWQMEVFARLPSERVLPPAARLVAQVKARPGVAEALATTAPSPADATA